MRSSGGAAPSPPHSAGSRRVPGLCRAPHDSSRATPLVCCCPCMRPPLPLPSGALPSFEVGSVSSSKLHRDAGTEVSARAARAAWSHSAGQGRASRSERASRGLRVLQQDQGRRLLTWLLHPCCCRCRSRPCMGSVPAPAASKGGLGLSGRARGHLASPPQWGAGRRGRQTSIGGRPCRPRNPNRARATLSMPARCVADRWWFVPLKAPWRRLQARARTCCRQTRVHSMCTSLGRSGRTQKSTAPLDRHFSTTSRLSWLDTTAGRGGRAPAWRLAGLGGGAVAR